MRTDTSTQLEFQGLDSRKVVSNFKGGEITSDAGGLLLREVDLRMRFLEHFSKCFKDHRDPEAIEHSVLDLVRQRIYGICLGYEDLNDHDDLRRDPLLATMVGKKDPSGADRLLRRDRGKALAGKSTLNRLELTPEDANQESRYQKIVYDAEAIDSLLVDTFLDSYDQEPQRIVIDLDPTDDPLHGNQEGKFFHGYYDGYCYLPLYIFCGEHLLSARLRPSNIAGADGALEEIQRMIAQIRERWLKVKILLRGDGDFSLEEIMAWCEAHQVDYLFGLRKNNRLLKQIEKKLNKSKRRYYKTRQASRRYHQFWYRTLKSWSRSRRVVAKVEYLEKGANPRFVVTSLSKKERRKQPLYEKDYCGRGDMENRIKEQQLALFSDRTSTAKMRSNQLRLYFSSIAYVLMHALRRIGCKGTKYAKAQCQTIREKFFKIGAQIKITCRRIVISMASGYPYTKWFVIILKNIQKRYLPLRI